VTIGDLVAGRSLTSVHYAAAMNRPEDETLFFYDAGIVRPAAGPGDRGGHDPGAVPVGERGRSAVAANVLCANRRPGRADICHIIVSARPIQHRCAGS